MPTPSLVAICISVLAADSNALYVLHTLPFRLAHRPPNLLADLVPDPDTLDPRLWAVLAQLYPSLPPFFAAYALPLADPDLPLLQSIPATPLFSLVTLLDLSSSQHLTDQTIFKLKFLHALTALDASGTTITTYAVKSLAATLQLNEDEDSPRKHRGPWELRILALRNCKHISNDVYFELTKFPLLSVVDLRGTPCTRNTASPFRPSMDSDLYHPTTLRDSLQALQSIQLELSASPTPYILAIDKLNHPQTNATPPQSRVGIQDSFVVFPSNSAGKINIGNTYVLERQIQEREDRIRHAKNKDAWYERNERIEDNEYYEDAKNILRKQVKRDLAVMSPLQNASTRLRSHPTSSLRLPSTSASESSHSRLSVARAHVRSSPPLSINRSHPNLHHPNSHPNPPSPRQLPFPHHLTPTSTSALSLVSAQRPPMKALPTMAVFESRPLNAHANARSGEHVNGTIIRSCNMNAAIQTGDTTDTGNGTGNAVASAIQDPGASSTSSRAPLTSLPTPVLNTRNTIPGATTNTSTVPAAQFYEHLSRVRRSAPAPKPAFNSGDAHLMLHRAPPVYHVLSEALAQEKERRTHSNMGALSNLNNTAVLSRHGKWALNAKEAMETAVKNRMGNGVEMKKMPVLPVVSLVNSTMRRVSFPAPSFSSSLAASSSSVMEPALSTKTQSRNPFRKRVFSYPDMPAFGGGMKVQSNSNFSSSSGSLASFISTATKPVMKLPGHLLPVMKTTATDKPKSKSGSIIAPPPVPLASYTSKASPAPSAPTGRQRTNSVSTPNSHAKPLIPISAVKVPILPDDMRKEAARREVLLASRKRDRVDEETEDVAPEPAAKKMANSSSIGKNKVKGKEKKAQVFDWTSWGKKDTLS